jgi:peptidoglycan/LPS O-acetylase OafA/YrhL
VSRRGHEGSNKNPAFDKLRRHTNAFDLIRLVAAALVLWSHQHALMGVPEPSVAFLQASYGGLGLYIFFAVSGYLNTLSVWRHRSVRVFLLNRVLRIYPALIACVVFTVVLGLFVATDLRAYVGPKLVSYTLKNSTLLFGVRMDVPGIFERNAIPGALNGSLWSLPYEVKMYIVLALCLAAARYNLVAPIVVFTVAGVVTFLAAIGILPEISQDSWLVFSTLFLAGSFVAAVQVFAELPSAVGILAVVGLALAGVGRHVLAWELALTAIVIAIGCINLPKWLRPPVDISYGVYLYAFPLQQLSATLFTNFWWALTFSVLFTFALALLSALFIERYALGLKGRIRFLSSPDEGSRHGGMRTEKRNWGL